MLKSFTHILIKKIRVLRGQNFFKYVSIVKNYNNIKLHLYIHVYLYHYQYNLLYNNHLLHMYLISIYIFT